MLRPSGAINHMAALLMEPINYDQGCIVPLPGFAQLCRDLCDRHGALLFFDEVLTACRMAPGGAQQYLGVAPDLCVLGKAFGGGMPISALAVSANSEKEKFCDSRREPVSA